MLFSYVAIRLNKNTAYSRKLDTTSHVAAERLAPEACDASPKLRERTVCFYKRISAYKKRICVALPPNQGAVGTIII